MPKPTRTKRVKYPKLRPTQSEFDGLFDLESTAKGYNDWKALHQTSKTKTKKVTK